jgi:hypothetical protein
MDLELQISAGELQGIGARWEFGIRLLKLRDGKGRLANGVLVMLAERTGASRSELQYRMQFAERVGSKAELSKTLGIYASWWQVVSEFLPGKAHVMHNSGESEWYTPGPIIEAARRVMGGIDLDPASSEAAQETVRAKRFFSKEHDGLEHRWSGRVWLNPPYAQPLIDDFCLKLEAELGAGTVTQAVCLTNNGTETHWGQVLLRGHSAVCFHDGRVRFWAPGKPSATPLQGQMITYFGPNVEVFCAEFSQLGAVCLNAQGLVGGKSAVVAATGTSTG